MSQVVINAVFDDSVANDDLEIKFDHGSIPDEMTVNLARREERKEERKEDPAESETKEDPAESEIKEDPIESETDVDPSHFRSSTRVRDTWVHVISSTPSKVRSKTPPARSYISHRSTAIDTSVITDEHLLAVINRNAKTIAGRRRAGRVVRRLVPDRSNTTDDVNKSPVKVTMTKIPNGYYVQKQIMDFAAFDTLVQLAFAILDRGYTVFGSFVHYLAWCANGNHEPKSINVIKRYMRKNESCVPRDIDVFNTDGRLSTVYMLDALLPSSAMNREEYDSMLVSGVRHMKYLYTIPNRYFGHIKVMVDAIVSDRISLTGLDFDVNSLTYSKEHGFRSEYEQKPPSIKDTLRRPITVGRVITSITSKTAKFVGKFDSGPTERKQRLLYVGRFRKMLSKGFNIVGWNVVYPKYTISHLDTEDRSCGICFTDFENGTVTYLSPCCSASTKKLLCDDCFWNNMKASAEVDRYHKCPFCRQKNTIFV